MLIRSAFNLTLTPTNRKLKLTVQQSKSDPDVCVTTKYKKGNKIYHCEIPNKFPALWIFSVLDLR